MTLRSMLSRRLAGSLGPHIDGQLGHTGVTPEPIPVALRDSGFRRLIELVELRDWVRETMCHLPDPAEAEMLRRLDDAIVVERSEPLVAHRSFEAVTHCPYGHVGHHGIDGEVTWDDRTYVERTCRYRPCAVSWLEDR